MRHYSCGSKVSGFSVASDHLTPTTNAVKDAPLVVYRLPLISEKIDPNHRTTPPREASYRCCLPQYLEDSNNISNWWVWVSSRYELKWLQHLLLLDSSNDAPSIMLSCTMAGLTIKLTCNSNIFLLIIWWHWISLKARSSFAKARARA